jgi:hypothetical protein
LLSCAPFLSAIGLEFHIFHIYTLHNHRVLSDLAMPQKPCYQWFAKMDWAHFGYLAVFGLDTLSSFSEQLQHALKPANRGQES